MAYISFARNANTDSRFVIGPYLINVTSELKGNREDS